MSKAFIKPFEAPKRSVNIKASIKFFETTQRDMNEKFIKISSGIGTGRFNLFFDFRVT